MLELGLIKLHDKNVRMIIEDVDGNAYPTKVNWIRLFNQDEQVYAVAFSHLNHQGCGIHLCRLNTKTGEFTSLANLLEEDGGPISAIRMSLGI
ncbi:MAG: hypothetical protein QMD92_00135 [bacterium]|nr:hypothetical protein [bacterium]